MASVVLFGAPGAAAADSEAGVSAGDLKKLSVEELLDVEVTSVSRHAEKQLDTAAAVQVITSEDIRRSGATRIPEALRLAPNLSVAQIDSSNWAISSRGFNSGLGNKLLVMVDGRTVYTPMFAGVFWDVQDTIVNDIDRIEVVSGPGGTVWGANAVNGVISVLTKSAADSQGLLLQAGRGDELEDYGAARYGGTLGSDVHYRVYGKYTDRDSTIRPNGSQWTDGVHSARGGFRFDWASGASDAFTFQGDLYDGESGKLITANHALYNGGNVLGRWERTLGADSGLTLQVYYDHAHRRIEGQYTDDLDTVDLDFQHRFALAGRHDVVWGFGLRQFENQFLSTPLFAFLPSKLTQQLFSAFAQDEIALAGEALRLTLGTKLEHNDYTGLEVQPNLRLAAKPAANQTVWAAVSRAIRAPARIDHDLYFPNKAPFFIAGGPDFVSEVLVAYELGYRVQPWERASIDLATFYNDYNHLRSVESAANPPAVFPYQVRNGLDGRSHGLELSTDFRVSDRWRVAASYRYVKLQLHVQPGHTDTTSVNAEAHDPRQQFMLRSMLDLSASLQLDATYRTVARIVNDVVPGYDEVDLRLAWRPLEQLEIAFLGENLLHDHHAEFSPLATRREIERSIFGKVTWGF
jgi:iron complex outermembrane receptor protein